jgi:hypothetical protein
MSEMANLLTEIEDKFFGNIGSALDSIRAGHDGNNEWLDGTSRRRNNNLE